MNLDAKIEAILFFKGESVSIKRLAELLDVNEESIKEAFLVLEQNLKNRGLQLIYKEDKVMLGTSKDMSSLLEKINKEELNKELSRASLETLTIILYKPEITRSEIDYIRGVNSSFIFLNNFKIQNKNSYLKTTQQNVLELYSLELEAKAVYVLDAMNNQVL